MDCFLVNAFKFQRRRLWGESLLPLVASEVTLGIDLEHYDHEHLKNNSSKGQRNKGQFKSLNFRLNFSLSLNIWIGFFREN